MKEKSEKLFMSLIKVNSHSMMFQHNFYIPIHIHSPFFLHKSKRYSPIFTFSKPKQIRKRKKKNDEELEKICLLDG